MIVGYDIARARAVAAKLCNVTVAELMGNSKARAPMMARHLLAYVLRRDAEASMEDACKLLKISMKAAIRGKIAIERQFASGVLSEAALDRALAVTGAASPPMKGPPAIARIRGVVARHFEIEASSLDCRSGDERVTIARHALMYLAQRHSGRAVVDICDILKTSDTTLRFAIANTERLAARGLVNIGQLEEAVAALPPRIPTYKRKDLQNGKDVVAA